MNASERVKRVTATLKKTISAGQRCVCIQSVLLLLCTVYKSPFQSASNASPPDALTR